MEKNDKIQTPPPNTEPPTYVRPPPSDDIEDPKTPTSAIANPGFLQMVQQRFEAAGDDNASFLVGNLAPEVVRRVNALRNLQVEHHKIEAGFFEEVHALECHYLSKYQSLYEKRLNIVKGTYEPTETEAKCAFDEEENDEEAKKAAAEAEKKPDEQKKEEEKTVGIPEFWLQVFKNSDVISDLIKEQDEAVLKHLIDVRITMQNVAEKKGFTIEFEFTSNEYFTNPILTKFYQLRTEPDEHDPLSYEGPEIVKSKGCTINWNKGKNVTVKMVKKRQKHKNRGTIRVITKEVQADSFFNFFTPPTVPEDAELDDTDEVRMLAADFEVGHMLRDSVIPKAVLYYTGEVGDEDDGDYDEDEDEEDDDDDYDEEPEEEEDEGHGHHHHASGRGGHHHGGGKHGPGGKSRGGKHGGAGANEGGQAPECKTQ